MNLTLYRGALPVAPRRRGVVPVAHRDVLLAALWPTGTGLLTPWATETEPSWPGGAREHETGPSREVGTARFLLWALSRGAVLTPRSRFYRASAPGRWRTWRGSARRGRSPGCRAGPGCRCRRRCR